MSKTFRHDHSSLAVGTGIAVPTSEFDFEVPTGYVWFGARRYYSTNMKCAIIGVRNTYVYIFNVGDTKLTNIPVFLDAMFIRDDNIWEGLQNDWS